MVKSLVIWVIPVPWQSKQNGAAVDASAEIVSYSYFYWKKYDCNWVTKLPSTYYCNMSRIRPSLIRCHWSFDPRWVKISGHSEQLRPCGSTSHFVNNWHSKVKTRGASCIGGFGQTNGRWKFELGIPQSRGASYIGGASYIRDKTVSHSLLSPRWVNTSSSCWRQTRTPPSRTPALLGLGWIPLDLGAFNLGLIAPVTAQTLGYRSAWSPGTALSHLGSASLVAQGLYSDIGLKT